MCTVKKFLFCVLWNLLLLFRCWKKKNNDKKIDLGMYGNNDSEVPAKK